RFWRIPLHPCANRSRTVPGGSVSGCGFPSGLRRQRTAAMDLGLQNRVVLVTGGAKGIGEGIAKVLAAEGALPVIIGRNAADNEAVVRAIVAASGQAYAVQAELTRTEECQRAVADALARFGRIEGLV